MVFVVGDSLDFLRGFPSFCFDVNFSDPPYALGSEVVVRADGRVDYSLASDFMDKWEMPTGDYWEAWFKEAYRTLKYGGYLLMFGMDRQLLLFKYYSALAGFREHQSLYWFFISNFPKASDLSKMLEKSEDIKPIASVLAKKYFGYKYSVAPLKQTNETIMVFQKPYKTGSCLHDALAYEGGDLECCCGALNIEKEKVPIKTGDDVIAKNPHTASKGSENYDVNDFGKYGATEPKDYSQIAKDSGRYPAQAFVDSGTAKILDEQSGDKPAGAFPKRRGETEFFGLNKLESSGYVGRVVGGGGGCSKILHKCDFEKDEHDLYLYCPKASKSERNAGLEGFEEKDTGHNPSTKCNICGKWILSTTNPCTCPPELRKEVFVKQKNNHPTLKPISLNMRILSLFKTPNPQKIVFPFAGVGSEVIGGIKAGFSDWEACEINSDYVTIALARIEYWSKGTVKVEKPASVPKTAEKGAFQSQGSLLKYQ